MKSIDEIKFNFKQNKFLKEIDPAILAKAATDITKAKTEFHRRRVAELKREQGLWERHAKLIAEDSRLDRKKAEREFSKLIGETKRRPPVNAKLFDQFIAGRNPSFFAPNFFDIGYGRSDSGVTILDPWRLNRGGRTITLPWAAPTFGLMGVDMRASMPGGSSVFTTGLANLFYSAAVQTRTLSASFFVTGDGLSWSVGLGYSRAWLQLGVEAWVAGPSRPATVLFRFMGDFWSSVPSPWVAERPSFTGQGFSTPGHPIPLLPGDLVMPCAVIEQGAVCGGLFTASRSSFLVSVSPLTI